MAKKKVTIKMGQKTTIYVVAKTLVVEGRKYPAGTQVLEITDIGFPLDKCLNGIQIGSVIPKNEFKAKAAKKS